MLGLKPDNITISFQKLRGTQLEVTPSSETVSKEPMIQDTPMSCIIQDEGWVGNGGKCVLLLGDLQICGKSRSA